MKITGGNRGHGTNKTNNSGEIKPVISRARTTQQSALQPSDKYAQFTPENVANAVRDRGFPTPRAYGRHKI